MNILKKFASAQTAKPQRPKSIGRLEKSIFCGFLAAVIAMTACNYTVFAEKCDDIRSKVFRLHILANSDSTADQALKIKVRDRILETSGDLFPVSGDKTDAEGAAQKNLDEIRQTAQDVVLAEGYHYPVEAEIVNMYFTTRTYGDITLPAGNYDALRITIGKGEGHNWWCVLFPPLCLPSAQGEQKLDSQLESGEGKIVTNSGQSYVLKFKVVEVYENTKNFFQNLFTKPKDDKKK